MKNEEKKIVQDFLATQQLATISTIGADGGRPQAAVIAFAELDGDLEIVFQTFQGTRKYNNIAKDPSVALVIGWSLETYITVQYEGEAVAIAQDKAHEYHEAFLRKDSPSSAMFLDNPKVRFYKIKPTWIRYSDFGCVGSRVFEYSFEPKK
jgi:pyridoxine/pyridoxamine 5'-phosphate oxidase